MPEPTKTTPYNEWLRRVIELTKDAWGRQGWHRPEDRVAGIERLIKLRRYRKFKNRARNVADLIVAVAPLVTDNGQFNVEKYLEHLQEPLYRLLPFLDVPVRLDLACKLVAEAATVDAVALDDQSGPSRR